MAPLFLESSECYFQYYFQDNQDTGVSRNFPSNPFLFQLIFFLGWKYLAWVSYDYSTSYDEMHLSKTWDRQRQQQQQEG